MASFTRDNWRNIYENVYAGEYTMALEAVKNMKVWKRSGSDGRKTWRGGMEVTLRLLEVGIQDSALWEKEFPKPLSDLSLTHLQLLYSTEIMRFLNMVCGSRTEDRKNISLYGRAKAIGIPDWIVNIRHDAAHKNSQAPIDILRMAYNFILLWLKKNYWEEEWKGLSEVKVEDEEEVVTDNLRSLLHIYVLLREQFILGFPTISHIQDPLVKELVLEINSFSIGDVKRRCRPWEVVSQTKEINIMKFKLLSIPNAIYSVMKMIRAFINEEDTFKVDTMSILIDKMIEDSVEHGGMRRDIWKVLIKGLHAWGNLPDVISSLASKSHHGTGEYSYQGGMWMLEICRALFKRHRVETWEARTTHSPRVKADEQVLTSVYLAVEELYPDLREVLRLKEALFPERWRVLELINTVSVNPSEFTRPSLLALYGILPMPFSKSSLKKLLELIRIQSGEGVSIVTKKKRIYTLADLPSHHLELTACTEDTEDGEESIPSKYQKIDSTCESELLAV